MISLLSRICCISEDSSRLFVTCSPSIVCLFTSVTIASSSISEYSKILQEDNQNNYLIQTLILLGISGITSGIISMSNCLQIIFQLSSSPVCIKIQKIWQILISILFLSGITLENLSIDPKANHQQTHLLNAEIALAILITFTIFMHFTC